MITSLDGINGSSIRTSLRGVRDSKGCLKFRLDYIHRRTLTRKGHRGERKETSNRNRKTSLKRNLLTAPKRQILIKSAKGTLDIFRLVKVQNQENYLKLLKKKNLECYGNYECWWSLSNHTKSPWIATVLVHETPFNFKLDSGAGTTVGHCSPILYLSWSSDVAWSQSLLIKCFGVLAIRRWTVRDNS